MYMLACDITILTLKKRKKNSEYYRFGSDNNRRYCSQGEYITTSLEKCPGCKTSLTRFLSQIMNRLTMAMRAHVNRYYQVRQCDVTSIANTRYSKSA